MEKNKYFNTKMIAATGLLLAIEIVLQLLTFVIPTTVNLNLSLIPIVIGAMLYGPLVGGFLGFMCGVIILLSPNTVTVFMSINPVATVFTCLLKTFVAGLVAGYLYRLIAKKSTLVGSIVASIIVPVINTFIFCIFTYFFFKEGLGLPDFGTIITAFIGVNFLFEVVSTVVIGPTLMKVIEQSKK